MRARRSILALATVALLLLAGCGDDGDSEVDAGDDGSSATTEAPVSTVPADEPIPVADAVGVPEGSSVTVRGYVFQPDEGATVMCDVFGESFPPTCTGPTLTTDGLDVNSLPGLETTSGGDLVAPATWTSAPVEVSGQIEAGRLVVSS